MTRTDALEALNVYLKNPNLIKHSLAAEAAMKAICKFLLKNPDAPTLEIWGLTGLLHDADYELAYQHPEKHGLLINEKITLPQDIAYAIKAHNWQNTKIPPMSQMDWAIACCDQLTGLIVAAALVHPDKKIAPITPDFVLRKFYDKSFAKGADRTSIMACEEKLKIPLIQFIEIVLNSMKEIATPLGL
jgi:predicted hydrolase (HD superfamily)